MSSDCFLINLVFKILYKIIICFKPLVMCFEWFFDLLCSLWKTTFYKREYSEYQRVQGDASIDFTKLQERQRNERTKSKIAELQMKLDKETHKVQSLQLLLDNAEIKLRETLTEMDEIKISKDDALSRLSELMGVKLRDNNPAITDLNDPNRPMKLAEHFNELYENAWTDTFANLTDGNGGGENSTNLSEEEAIEILLNILKEVNQICCDEACAQLSKMLEPFENFPSQDTSKYIKTIKDLHKSIAEKYIPLTYQKVVRDDSPCQTVTKYHRYCQPYIENCVNVCYLAAVQDPPMFLHFEPEEVYDKQVFKEYTAMGSRVRYLVWPALFLYKGGALLAKGVIQPFADGDALQP